MTQPSEIKGTQAGSAPVEKRGAIDGDTPFLADQDDLDATERVEGLALAPPGRTA